MNDAVILVPGLMGSRLLSRDGRVLWGMDLATVAAGRNPPHFHKELQVQEQDLKLQPNGPVQDRRVRADGLLTCPTYFPFHSVEPYTAICRELSDALHDPRAFTYFAYDWRLPISFNALEFAARAKRHLALWRLANAKCNDEEPRLVVVAHSMGGLVAWEAIQGDAELHQSVRSLVTLGTPFGGSLASLQVLAHHGHAKVPPLTTRVAARSLARTCPGVYDLLPRGPHVVDGRRPVTADDVSAVGGDRVLAQDAVNRRGDFALDRPHRPVALSALAGTNQDTASEVHRDPQSGRFRFDDLRYSPGDTTVVESDAFAPGRPRFTIPQVHGALASCPDGITFARKRAMGEEIGAPLARPGYNVVMDDCQPPGRVWLTVKAPGSGICPTVTSNSLGRNAKTRWNAKKRDGDWRYEADLAPGIYRVVIPQDGFSPISRLLCVEHEER